MSLTKQELNQINHAVMGMVKFRTSDGYMVPVERILPYLSTFCDDAYIVCKDGGSELKLMKEKADPPEEKPISDSSPL